MQPLYEDDLSITYRMDDGQEHRIPKQTAQNIGLPAPQAEAHNLGLGQAPQIHPNVATADNSLESAPVPLSGGEETLPMPEANPLAQVAQGAGQVLTEAVSNPEAQQYLQNQQAAEARQAKLQGYQQLAAPNSSAQGAANVGMAAGLRSEAMGREAQAKRDQSNALAAQQKKNINTLEKHDQGVEAFNKKQREQEQRYWQESEAARKKYMDAEIDPNRFWKSRTSGQKVMAGIAMALSGIGKAANVRMGLEKPGGMLMPLQMMIEAADKDVAIQEKQIAKLGSNVKMMDDRLARYQQMGSTELERRSQMRAAYVQKGVEYLKYVQQATNDPIIAANAEVAQAELMGKAAEFGHQAATQREAAEAAERRHRQNLSLGYAKMKAQERRWQHEQQQRERAISAQAAAASAEDKRLRGIKNPRTGEVVVMATDPKMRTEVQEKLRVSQNMREDLVELQRLSGKLGRSLSGRLADDDRKKVEAIHRRLTLATANDQLKGVLSDQDIKFIGEMIGGGPQDMLSRSGNMAALSVTVDNLDRDVVTYMQSHTEGFDANTWHAFADSTEQLEDASHDDSLSYQLGNASDPGEARKVGAQLMADLALADSAMRQELPKKEQLLASAQAMAEANPGDQQLAAKIEELQAEVSTARQNIAKADDAYAQLETAAKGSGKGAKQAQAILQRYGKKQGQLFLGPARKYDYGSYRHDIGPVPETLTRSNKKVAEHYVEESDPDYIIHLVRQAKDPNHPSNELARRKLGQVFGGKIPQHLLDSVPVSK